MSRAVPCHPRALNHLPPNANREPGTALVEGNREEWSSSEPPTSRRGHTTKLHELHKKVPASRWCVNLKDLEYFRDEVRKLWELGLIPPDGDRPNPYHDLPHIGPTIYQVNEHYIKPFTKAHGGMSWALWRHNEGLECDVFATHCWAEGVFEFVDKVRRAWPMDHEAQNLYCCFLANPQTGGIEELLGSPERSPFALALGQAKYFLVIPNRTVSIYKRLWCVYEAHLAVRRANEGDLKITLPSTVAPKVMLKFALPGLLTLLTSFAVAYLVLARFYGVYLGPLLWMVSCMIASSILGNATRLCAEWLCRGGKIVLRVLIISYWGEMLIIGHGMGLAFWHLRGFADDNICGWKMGNTFQRGEGWACVPLGVCFVSLYIARIWQSLSRQIAKREGVQLDFISVKEATCTNQNDETRIREAITGCEDLIDTVIRTLSLAGRYDSALVANMERGMSANHARGGCNPIKILIAVWTWEYWWVTDLAANWHHIVCLELPGGTCVIAMLCWYCFRDHVIFGVDAAYFGGLGFVAVSKFINKTSLSEAIELDGTLMSMRTLHLQVLGMVATFTACLYHYCGWRRRFHGIGGVRFAAECSRVASCLGCEDVESDRPIEDEEWDEDELALTHCLVAGTECRANGDGDSSTNSHTGTETDDETLGSVPSDVAP